MLAAEEAVAAAKAAGDPEAVTTAEYSLVMAQARLDGSTLGNTPDVDTDPPALHHHTTQALQEEILRRQAEEVGNGDVQDVTIYNSAHDHSSEDMRELIESTGKTSKSTSSVGLGSGNISHVL